MTTMFAVPNGDDEPEVFFTTIVETMKEIFLNQDEAKTFAATINKARDLIGYTAGTPTRVTKNNRGE